MQTPSLKEQFLLDPAITYLNFGSFGACPRVIFEDYQQWQLELEREPVQFIQRKGLEYLQQSRAALAGYVHCAADDLVYVTNPSYAVNIIAKSLRLDPGDEVLGTDLEYGACERTWNYYCRRAGARFVRQPVRLPVVTKEQFIEDFFKGLSPKTRLVFISHITSTTALIFPVKEICAIAREKGLLTFVDGAHVPGHIPLDLSTLGADIYTGACHKWMLTPKGCSFLYVKKEWQHLFDPLVISWGYESAAPSHSTFLDYHQAQGTRDFSAFLTVPRAIRFLRDNDWENVAARCRALVKDNALRLCGMVGSDPLSPLTDEFLGQMFSVPIRTQQPEQLQRHLFEEYRIEVPVMKQEGRTFLRYSVNGFNGQEDLDRLTEAVKAEGISFLNDGKAL
ncbi:MAG TPA: aminotransferase class V-fold PLP-dependent enzyme [Puia sp.]|jgi:isopenicillin-N epimerase